MEESIRDSSSEEIEAEADVVPHQSLRVTLDSSPASMPASEADSQSFKNSLELAQVKIVKIDPGELDMKMKVSMALKHWTNIFFVEMNSWYKSRSQAKVKYKDRNEDSVVLTVK